MSRSNLITSRRAFTVIELSVVLVIIALLAGILIVGVREALRTTRGTAEKQFVSVLKLGVEQFREQFGVVPPLVDDAQAFNAGNNFRVPIAGEVAGDNQSVLRYLTRQVDAARPRYSERTLPLYILGAGNKEIDGVEGLGFTSVERSGQFSRRGKPHEPLFAAEREQTRIVVAGTRGEDTRLFDKYVRPRGQPIRYYRWSPTYFDRTNVTGGAQIGDIKDHNVPPAVGDPAKRGELRSATWAVVSAGPDGAINDTDANAPENADNIVEVGQ